MYLIILINFIILIKRQFQLKTMINKIYGVYYPKKTFQLIKFRL